MLLALQKGRITLMKARDASILAGNFPDVQKVQSEINNEDGDRILVYLRVKATTENYDELYEIKDSKTLISKIPEGSYSARNTKESDLMKKKYNFSKIFRPDIKQSELFSELVKPKVLKFINGDNSTVMTYGVSGSGKTYTIIGTAEEPGVLPRSLDYLFRTLPKLPDYPNIKPLSNGEIIWLGDEDKAREAAIKRYLLNFNWPNEHKSDYINTYRAMQTRLSQDPVADLDDVSNLTISVWVSFAEIYNEHIYDLLQPEVAHGKKKDKLKLGSSNGNTYIKNLTNVHISSGLEAFQILQYGLHHLNYAKTKINDHSSRSHSIFTIKLALSNKDMKDESLVSHFNFCDLAGSERVKKTLNVGDRLKESNNINTSLLVLGRCISGVRNAQKGSDLRLIPFRESKLTQIFQNALSGFEDICMIVNVNPCRELFDETQHVLNFSALAKEIVVIHQPRIVTKKTNHTSGVKQGNGAGILCDESNKELLEKKMKYQHLLNEIAECKTRTELEEMNQMVEVQELRDNLLPKYYIKFENEKEDFEIEYQNMQLTLKKEYKEKLKAAKLEYESMKENYDLSFSSDSSDEDVDFERPVDSSTRKRKHSADDVDTVCVLSSDEEDEIQFWEQKIKSQESIISKLHDDVCTTREEINNLRSKVLNKQKLEKIISEQRQEIESLSRLGETFGERF